MGVGRQGTDAGWARRRLQQAPFEGVDDLRGFRNIEHFKTAIYVQPATISDQPRRDRPR
jgi:hypothetical protein